ncbi:hypothetical protein DY000_02039241 [Brassica cretica]|uniref:Uncharacterized protein n=1 Tax=Brassica cretica TaxID=69181 RepID=A0ABQ7B6W5_BRACR|nr:hypothetical protein DY000_02039241 [Brassica cretica]
MELDTHEHFGRAGRSDTYLGELVELNQGDTYISELDELSDTILELNELSDTEDGAGLVAGRNEPFSAQRKIHNKFNLGRFYTKFDQTFPQSISGPLSSRIPRGNIMELDTHEHFGRAGRSDTYLGELVELNQGDTYISELDELSDTILELNELSDTEDGAEHFLFLGVVSSKQTSLFRWTCVSYQETDRNPCFVGLVRHIKQQLKSGSIKRLSAPLVSPFNLLVLPFWRVHILKSG